MVSSFWHNLTINYSTHTGVSMLVHLYDAGPVLKQDVQQLGYM